MNQPTTEHFQILDTPIGALRLVSNGSSSCHALALVLIGGLLSSTIFVLTITPAAYHVLERGRAVRSTRSTRSRDGDPGPGAVPVGAD